ncbi:MAG: peptide chain release factor N(5)-glutamine methyltransferase [Nitrospirae bacterium]|nr:peptide chain release factor N(5)-glutamine methyltransferase [Candidatus Troglogloeales bacterium]
MGFAKPRQEAEEILATLLSVRRIDLYLDSNRLVSNEDNSAFVDKIIRRGRHEPLQYITGRVDFCGLPFSVSPGVFIPRPETELIVEEINQLKINPQSILDLCTGSGALAIALAKRFPLASITAIDCSKIALDTARLNQQRHHAYQITFSEGDLFSPLTPQKDIYDLIVCNPPYIAEEDWQTMDPEVLEYEPPLALFSEDCGLAHLKSVLRKAPPFLSPLGVLILEIGMGQSVRLIDFVKNNTPLKASVVKDFAGIDRILICQSSNASPSRGG